MLLLFVQFILLATLVVMVTYRAVPFSGHMHHIYVLDLDMDNDVAFLVSYEPIGASLILNIRELIFINTV